MSRSYGKYLKRGICFGNNTEYYRDRNRRLRNKNRHNIKNLVKNKSIEDIDDLFIPAKEPDNYRWNEPTDGTWHMTPNDVKNDNYKGVYLTKNNKIKK
jgi:hypothetical protein